eukprot:scaffold1282_cov251-Pinguiococcus_pyrenoidosus.AAC.12
MAHFESLGFRRPPMKDVADYLQEVSTEDGQDYVYLDWHQVRRHPPPKSTAEFVQRWEESRLFRQTMTRLLRPTLEGRFPPSVMREFSLSWLDNFTVCIRRSMRGKGRDAKSIRLRLVQQLVVSSLIAGLFSSLPKDAVRSRYGVIFLAVMGTTLGSTSALPMAYRERAVFYKQRDASFYPTSSYTLASTLVDVPMQMLETTLWTTIVYWAVGLSASAGGSHYGIFIAVCVLLGCATRQFFGIVVAAIAAHDVAIPVGGTIVVTFTLFSGFVIPEGDIPLWFISFYHVNPMAHGFTILAQNEFLSESYDYGISVGGNETVAASELYLTDQGLSTDPARTLFGTMALFAYAVCCWVVSSYLLHTLRHEHPHLLTRDDRERATQRTSELFYIAESGSLDESGRVSRASRLSRLSPGPFSGRSFHMMVAKFRWSKVLSSPIKAVQVDLVWRDVSYYVEAPAPIQRLEILHQVSGFALHGTCTAIIGPSGSGKTTLLKVLSGRRRDGYVLGNVYMNGHKCDKLSRSRLVGYVEQRDEHIRYATFLEALRFSARLRLDACTDDKCIEHHIKNILDDLDLNEEAHRQVAFATPEMAKRLSIAVELAANPSVLLLDEPTTGLGARSAAVVVAAIRRAARAGLAVLASVNQPSQAIFDQFDTLLLLQRGGRTVFFGDTGVRGQDVVRYFSAIPNTIPYTLGTNPAIYALNVIGAGPQSQKSEFDFATAWQESRAKAKMEDMLMRPGMAVVGRQAAPTFESDFASPLALQIRLITWRACLSNYRSPRHNATRVLFAAFVGLLFGVVYFQQDYYDFSTAYARISLIYMTTLFIGLICFINSIMPFYQERAVFYRERSAKMYTVLAYGTSTGLAEVPYIFLATSAFGIVYYFTVGFNPNPRHLFEYFIFILLWIIFATFYAQFWVSAMPTRVSAMVAGGATIQIMNFFAGFIQPVAEIPQELRVLHWASPLHYTFEGLLTSQFRGDETAITTIEEGTGDITRSMSDFVKERFPRFDVAHLSRDMAILIAFIVVFRFATFVCLYRLNYAKV